MTAAPPVVLRYAAFTETPAGGNRAGVVLDAREVDADVMQAIAREVGYSETAFLMSRGEPVDGVREFDVRYFSPAAEVPFCGHATIAAAAAVAEHMAPGNLLFHTQSGAVPVVTSIVGGCARATLTSVEPSVGIVEPAVLATALDALGWEPADLDSHLPPRIAFAGARHLIVGVRSREILAALDYNFGALTALCAEQGWITVDVVWRETPVVFHARNPFPYGGVVEDPATGAAAAALGGYLRDLGLVAPDASVTIFQGADMGSPSRIDVTLHTGQAGIDVTGSAVRVCADRSTRSQAVAG